MSELVPSFSVLVGRRGWGWEGGKEKEAGADPLALPSPSRCIHEREIGSKVPIDRVNM